MRVRLDHHSGEPIWRQIVEQIKYAIACGTLISGDRLPSIRSLAEELGVNPRTVVKSYEELQHMGLAVMQQGRGVFVDMGEMSTPSSVRRQVIGDLGRRLFAEALRLGGEPGEVLEVLRGVAKEMQDGEH